MLNRFYDKYIFTNTLKYTHNNFSLVNIPFLMIPIDILMILVATQDNEKQKEIYNSFKESTIKNFMPKFKELGIEESKKLDFVKNFFIGSGWGFIQIIDLDNAGKKAIVTIDNSPFVENLKGKTKIAIDSILRGILAGLFSHIFNEDIDCVEVECVALGAKNCKFIIKHKSEFDLEKKIVREQLIFD